jgi:hypothetical protein
LGGGSLRCIGRRPIRRSAFLNLIKENCDGNCEEGNSQEGCEEITGQEVGRQESTSEEEGAGKEVRREEVACEEGRREEGACKEGCQEKGACKEGCQEKGACEEGCQEKGACEKSGEEICCEESSEKACCQKGRGPRPGCKAGGPSCQDRAEPCSSVALPDRQQALSEGALSKETRLRPGFFLGAPSMGAIFGV